MKSDSRVEDMLKMIADKCDSYTCMETNEGQQHCFDPRYDDGMYGGGHAKELVSAINQLIQEARIDELAKLQNFLKTAHLYDQDSAMKLRYHFNDRLKQLSAPIGGSDG